MLVAHWATSTASVRIGAASLLVAAVVALSATNMFVDVRRLRVKLVETPPPSAPTISVTSRNLNPLIELQQPLALIVRATNQSGADIELTVAVDGAPICRPRLDANESRRIDCIAARWSASEVHEVAIHGPTAAWSLTYLELATHYGNTTGANYLVILPRTSTHYRRPSLIFIVTLCLALVAAIAFVAPWVAPPWLVAAHRFLAALVIAAMIAILLSPWVSEYRVVVATWTVVLWLAVLLLPRTWTAARWLAAAHVAPRAAWIAWTRRAMIALAVFALFWLVARSQLRYVYNGNYSGFLSISRRLYDANPLLNRRDDVRQTLLLRDNGGYDGQFVYFATFDPLMRAFRDDPVKYRSVVDAVPYRFGRIGSSLLTRAVSFGSWRLYPAVTIWLILIALSMSAMALASMAEANQLTPLLGGLVVLVPGFWQSLQGGLPEPLAAATLIGGVACVARNRCTAGGILFALSLLIRETGIVLVVAIVAAIAWTGDRRVAFRLAMTAMVPVVVWRLYVGWTIFPDWGFRGFLDHPADLSWPFSGFADLWAAIRHGDYYPGGPAMGRAGIAFPLLLIFGLVIASALAVIAPDAINIAALCYAILAVCLNFQMIWVHVGNGQRGTYELFVALALATTSIRAYPRLLQVALALLWFTAGVYVFYLTYDAELIRAALSFPG